MAKPKPVAQVKMVAKRALTPAQQPERGFNIQRIKNAASGVSRTSGPKSASGRATGPSVPRPVMPKVPAKRPTGRGSKAS